MKSKTVLVKLRREHLLKMPHNLQKLYFIDIDGVMANIDHRLHYMREKNYDKFYSADEMVKDEKIVGFSMFNDMINDDPLGMSEVIIVTGRPERTRKVTEMWLNSNWFRMGKNTILMRKDGDYRKSDIVKKELVNSFMKGLKKGLGKDGFDWICRVTIIDDDPSNVISMVEAVRDNYNKELNAIVFGTTRLNGCVQNTSSVAVPDTDKKRQRNLLSAFRERRNHRH